MCETPSSNPKIYHIVHVDRLRSIIEHGGLWCDAEVIRKNLAGTSIGMSDIKQRRLEKILLTSHPNVFVGQCVPFYFCPRPVMLYVISRRNNPGLQYNDGQDSIIHLEADLRRTVDWANDQGYRWAFTLSNAGSDYFEYRSNLENLNEINWDAVEARQWGGENGYKEGKQAEFLVESFFSFHLVDQIGVLSDNIRAEVERLLTTVDNCRPDVRVMQNWYY